MQEEATSGFIGFSSPLDFFYSLVGAKSWVVNAGAAFIAGLTSFITNYIWDDPTAVYTLWSLMFADWMSGITKAVVNKRFVSFKIWRMPLYFVATSYILHISWYMAKSNGIYYYLPGVVIGGFYSVYFVSLLENLGDINALPKPFAKILKSRFGLKKLIEKEEKNDE